VRGGHDRSTIKAMSTEPNRSDPIESAPSPVAAVSQSKGKRKPAWSLAAIVGEIGASGVCFAALFSGLRTAVAVFCCWALFSAVLWIACRRWRLRQAGPLVPLPIAKTPV
jgi:hypothetical protein